MLETENYILEPIERNRFKITLKSGKFNKTYAQKINGCYYSGNQNCWVIPQTSLSDFEALFTNKIKTENIFFESHNKALKEFKEHLILKRYSKNTMKVYEAQFQKFLNHYLEKNPEEISDEDVKKYLLQLFEIKEVSLSLQKQVVCSIHPVGLG